MVTFNIAFIYKLAYIYVYLQYNSNTIIQLIYLILMDLKTFSYTTALEEAAKASKWNDTLTDFSKLPRPVMWDSPNHSIEGNHFPLKNGLADLLEFQNNLFYFFTQQSNPIQKAKSQFKLIVYFFAKMDGNYHRIDVKQLKGTPSCIATGLSSYEQPIQRVNGDQKPQRLYKVVALVGLKEGFIKIIEFVRANENRVKPIVSSHKLQHKAIQSIHIPQKTLFNHKNVCFVLLEDCKVILFNFVSKMVVAIFQPPILGHDTAVCFTLHCSGRYFATASKSGQITFWEVTEKIYEAVLKSEQAEFTKQKGSNKKSIVIESDSDIQTKRFTFKSKDRVINVFPMYMIHSASINGLKWVSFLGNLLMMVSRPGLLRLIAINFQAKDEFIIIMEYQIQNGESISSVQLFAEEQVVFVTKANYYIGLVDCDNDSAMTSEQNLRWKEGMLKKNDSFFRMNYNSYTPKKSGDSCLERITFSSGLSVQEVKRVYVKDSRNGNVVNFDRSILSHKHRFGLFYNEANFYIGLCDQN